jgi:hypothetical protein
MAVKRGSGRMLTNMSSFEGRKIRTFANGQFGVLEAGGDLAKPTLWEANAEA